MRSREHLGVRRLGLDDGGHRRLTRNTFVGGDARTGLDVRTCPSAARRPDLAVRGREDDASRPPSGRRRESGACVEICSVGLRALARWSWSWWTTVVSPTPMTWTRGRSSRVKSGSFRVARGVDASGSAETKIGDLGAGVDEAGDARRVGQVDGDRHLAVGDGQHLLLAGGTELRGDDLLARVHRGQRDLARPCRRCWSSRREDLRPSPTVPIWILPAAWASAVSRRG